MFFKSKLFSNLRKIGAMFCTLVALTVSAVYFSVPASANNTAWYISTSDPYLQDWSIPTLITANDNWDNLIAVNGYRGDGLATTAGTDPQTILADGAGTPLNVIANQSNPNTLTTGGVAEFDGIPNPTIALQGSGTASAPHLVILLNKESCPDTKFISISYKVRDIDGSADNAIQQVALQYRVGDTGSYTNLPDAFVADATDPNAATKVTNVVGNLPHIPTGLDRIFLRIITANAVGNDEWVGIDDINIGCYAPTAASVPVSGRVFAGKGSGVARANVTMTDDSGKTETARTNNFGYYRFESVEVGKTYTVTVSGKGINPISQLVTVNDAMENLDFFIQ
jgi:hypothetical protein